MGQTRYICQPRRIKVIGARRRQVYDHRERWQGLIGVGAALDSDCQVSLTR